MSGARVGGAGGEPDRGYPVPGPPPHFNVNSETSIIDGMKRNKVSRSNLLLRGSENITFEFI